MLILIFVLLYFHFEFVNLVLFYIKFDVMVKFVFDEIEYVERIEQVEDLELSKIIRELHQFQSKLENEI
jgi:hypothetical protein